MHLWVVEGCVRKIFLKKTHVERSKPRNTSDNSKLSVFNNQSETDKIQVRSINLTTVYITFWNINISTAKTGK